MHSSRVLVLALLIACIPLGLRAASDHVGYVTLGEVPVPGVKVVAAQGDTRVTAYTNAEGAYRLAGLAEGTWTISLEMVGFAPATRQITVAPDAQPERWALTMKPFDEITRGIPIPPPEPARAAGSPQRPAAQAARGPAAGQPNTSTADAFRRAGVAATPQGTPAPGAAAGGPPPPAQPATFRPAFADDAPAASADSLVVSGSTNNSAASPLSQAAALGNARRALGIRLYNAQLSIGGGGSALDASSFSLTGRPAPTRDYRDINVSGNFSGPFKFPGLVQNGPNLTLNYTRTSNSSANTLSETMPTLLQRQGNFSQTVDGFGRPVQIIDPQTGLPFSDNTIPADRLSPQALALLRYYPLPDLATNGTFNYQIPNLGANQSDSFRANMPQLISNNRYQIGGGGSYSRRSSESTSLFGFDNASEGSGFDTQVNWIYRLGNSAQLRLRHGYSRQTNTTEPFFSNRVNVSGDAGITGNNQEPINWGPPSLVFSSGIAGLTDAQYSRNVTQSHTFGGDTLRSRGRHTLTIGGSARHQRLDIVAQQNARGGFTFNGSVSGYDFADFLLGIPSTSAIAYGNADKNFRSWILDAYVTDDFRVTPNFTMQIGLRWDFETPVKEAGGRLVNLDVAPDFSAAAPITGDNPIGPVTGRQYPDALVQTDPFGFQPRFGLAWRPIIGSSIVVRGGYGMYRNTNVYQSIATVLSQQPPLSRTFNATNTAATPLTLANGFIAPTSGTLNTFAIDPDFATGSVHRWEGSIQYDLPASLTVVGAYRGGRGFHLMQAFLPNTYAPGAVNLCPLCPSGFTFITSDGDSIQHAGQVQLRRRLRGGLTWSTTYTLGKATDNASGFSGVGAIGGAGVNGVGIAQNWLDLDAERGPSTFDQRHQFSAQVQYTTGQGVAGGMLLTGLKGALIKGWVFSTQMTTGSGSRLTPTYRLTSVAGVTGTVRADLTGEPIDAAPAGYYVNPAAFAPPAAGTWGTAGRNSLRGPNPFSMNASVSRQFPLPNRVTLNWQIDATNVLNRRTDSSIDTVVGSTRFGLPIATSPARTIRTNLRMSF